MSIRCHSAFKHYEMFHSRGGDVINIGSNNTTIFNCGGSHLGGFWGGLGLGLGSGFGNLFGGFGMGLPGMGLPGMGFGFPMFSGLGNIWGNRDNSPRVDKDDSANEPKNTTVVEEKVDPDRETINKLWTRKNELLAKKEPAATAQELQALLDDIIDAEKNQDKNPIHDAADKKDFDNLKYGLENMIKTAKEREALDGEEVKPKEVTAPPAAEVPEEVDEPENPHKYNDGYTNYDGETELKDGDVIRATDTSGATRDTVSVNNKPSTITKSSDGPHPQTIIIHDTKDITYTYDRAENGEYIYTSNQDNQEYILQKNSNGKYDLVQYEWNKGYGEKDWSPEE